MILTLLSLTVMMVRAGGSDSHTSRRDSDSRRDSGSTRGSDSSRDSDSSWDSDSWYSDAKEDEAKETSEGRRRNLLNIKLRVHMSQLNIYSGPLITVISYHCSYSSLLCTLTYMTLNYSCVHICTGLFNEASLVLGMV